MQARVPTTTRTPVRAAITPAMTMGFKATAASADQARAFWGDIVEHVHGHGLDLAIRLSEPELPRDDPAAPTRRPPTPHRTPPAQPSQADADGCRGRCVSGGRL